MLKSLRLRQIDNIGSWLNNPLCPFNFSRLAVLSVHVHTSVLGWTRIAPALRTIEALELTMSDKAQGTINLSLFPNLLFLRMKIDKNVPRALDTLSTFISSSRIRQIVVSMTMARSPGTGWQLDSKVASLPLQHTPTLGLEMSMLDYDRWAQARHFPQLHPQNLLFHADTDWFETQICRKKSPP
ncbi:hypothetical protein MVEN_00388800 [Mycena venus]|uniref:Uncharacterized protein n=1 Tax=Mycena venus TaxID=2733690 RepID=A0A8H7DAR3_9AGAR|nr:hypothetical protein MVEN_00388800 [Mycena venus]